MFTLFRDEDAFSPEHIPDSFLYRESQMAALQQCLRPAVRKQKPINAYLVGKPATGKTTALRIALQQLEEAADAVCIHIHCIGITTFRILSEIHKKLLGFLPPETGVPISRIQDLVFQKLAKEKRPLIVALDDVLDIQSVEEAIYAILRAHESYAGVKTAVLIASTKNELHRLDDRTRSSFSPETINFTPYTAAQITGILSERARIGLAPGVASLSVIKRIAETSADLRMAISTLRAAVLKAEAEGKKSIMPEHVGIEETKEKNDPLLNELHDGPLDSGELFQKVGGSYSKFYRTLKRLESEGKIKINDIQKGKGKSRLIELNH